MKPNDDNGRLPVEQRPFRVLIVSGSNRRQYNCPGVDSKSRALMLRMAERLPQEWEIDYEDLGNVYGREHIQGCNACVSTSLCCWPCNCYERGSKAEPDLMWNLDLYSRLDLADAWAIIGPVNWYAPTTNIKAMFDRLVCMNGGNPREDLIEHKNPELAMKLEHAPEWKELAQNHLEGRTAGFFCYGDDADDERDETGRPVYLRHPEYFDPHAEPYRNLRDTYAPLVWQCRFSGIEVPDSLWRFEDFGRDRKYSDNQAEDMVLEPHFLEAFDAWTHAFAEFVTAKGKVEPGKYRAFGYEPPAHRWADVKLYGRDLAMRVGHPPSDSSPKAQRELGLNKDDRLDPKKGEGQQLRDGSAD
jgi:multimeric flavodoxin WrbA